MKSIQKHIVIVDTDTGIDDATAHMLFMFDPHLDIKLYTTVKGNVPVEIATNNTLHLLELYGKKTPLAKGAQNGIKRITPDASWLHGKTGLGETYIASQAKTKPLNLSAEEAMYNIIKKFPHKVTIIALGPHTNIAKLLLKHPDAVSLIKGIICEGFSAYGTPGIMPHISFNVSSDPEAFKVVIDSKVPLTIIPSEIGRAITYLTEKQVSKLDKINDSGKFLKEIYQHYWAPEFTEKRIATNDTLAYMYLVEPEIFKYEMADVAVNLQDDSPGKTWATIAIHGQVKLITNCNRRKFMKSFYHRLRSLKKFKFDRYKK